ncbi:MAG: tetratricopeptide repeat protein [Sphingobacteriales bacterium]|nr:tetratricopeptide repeat protein [Sphingobacteriales bacterium]
MNRRQYFISVLFLSYLLIGYGAVALAGKKKKEGNSVQVSSAPITKKDVEEQSVFIEGMQAYLLGNTQDAAAKFNEVLRRDSKNHAAYYLLAKIAFETGNMDKVIEYAQNAIRYDPNNEYYYQYLAEAKAEKNDFEGASKVYDLIVKLNPKDYDYYYDWAYMLSKAGKLKEAVDVYNQLEQKTGVSEELVFQKQPLLLKMGKVDECIKDVEKLIKLYPDDTRYVGLIGEIYESYKMYDKAIGVYKGMLVTDTNNAYAMMALAEMYRKNGNIALHDEWVQKIFNNKNINIDAKILTIIPYIEKLARDSSLKTEVMKMADMLVALHPNDVKAITARADVLYNVGSKKEAQGEYIKAVNMSDVPSTVWIQLYILNAELEDYDNLIVYSKIGIEKNPDDPFGYFYNAIANQQKKYHKEAASVLLTAFAMQQKSPNAAVTPQLSLQMLILLGDISFELRDYDRTDSSYEAALEIDPNNATVLNNYAYYLSERNIKLEKAERMSKKSNLLVDNNSAFIDTYAWIMYKMKNYSEALDWIEQAMVLPDSKERAELLTHYGDILFKSGQTEKAIEQWKRAIEKGGDKEALESKIKAGI